jgi:hypothetical protein
MEWEGAHRFKHRMDMLGQSPFAGLTPMSDWNSTSEAVEATSQRFRTLAARWKANRGPRSTVKSMTQEANYLAIIDIGEPALPFILAELVREPDHWFAALRAITGVNPVPPEDKGNLEKMAAASIEWGRLR